MNLDELIIQGKEIAAIGTKDGYGGKYIYSEQYEQWLMLSTRFLQQNYPGDPLTQRYQKVAQSANGNGEKYFLL